MKKLDFNKSERFYLDAQSIFKDINGEKDSYSYYIKATTYLANLYAKQGNISKADEYYSILNIVSANYTDEINPEYLRSYIYLAEYNCKIGYYTKAEMILLSVIRNCEKSDLTNNSDYIDALYTLACVYYDRNDQINAEKILIQIKNTSNDYIHDNSVIYVKTLNILSEIYFNRSDFENCENILIKLQGIYESNKFKHDLVYARILIRFAKLNYATRKYKLAENNYLQAINIYKLISGEENQDYIYI
jgi:tetratricopeptide (TPR) repeat protein